MLSEFRQQVGVSGLRRITQHLLGRLQPPQGVHPQGVHPHAVAAGVADVDRSVPVGDRLPGRYGAGALASLSFDQGFTREEDRELLSLYVPGAVMPKRGQKNATQTQRESGKKFVALRQQHSAVESETNSLEHHGLNRCLDMGLAGYLRHVGYGVMSYNLHVSGRHLLARASG